MPIAEAKPRTAAHVLPDCDVERASTVLCTVVHRGIRDRLRMTKPDLASQGLGFEL